MKLKSLPLITAAALLIGCTIIAGCVAHKVTTVTPASTNAVTGVITGPVTNTVVVVNTNTLNLECAGLKLVGAPALIYALQKDPDARPIVQDIQTALTGALNGADTNVVSTINGLIGGNDALQASVQPLIQGASDLEQQLLAEYGSKAAVQIAQAILRADLAIVTSALTAVPTK